MEVHEKTHTSDFLASNFSDRNSKNLLMCADERVVTPAKRTDTIIFQIVSS